VDATFLYVSASTAIAFVNVSRLLRGTGGCCHLAQSHRAGGLATLGGRAVRCDYTAGIVPTTKKVAPYGSVIPAIRPYGVSNGSARMVPPAALALAAAASASGTIK
jgi:hypothetical protein